MKQSLLQLIQGLLFGHKYYVNIVNRKGTDICEASSFIHATRREAVKHRQQIRSTRSFMYVETVSFRSHRKYLPPTLKPSHLNP